MEELILKEFEKQNSKAGQILMLKNLNFGLYQRLTPKQQDGLQDAINNLIDSGLIRYEDASSGPECLRLTDLGFSRLYSGSKTQEQIERLVLKEFEKQKSRAGDIIMLKNLNFGLFQSLNPKESELFEPALNSLIDKGLITYEGERTGVECIRLTEQGYDNLY